MRRRSSKISRNSLPVRSGLEQIGPVGAALSSMRWRWPASGTKSSGSVSRWILPNADYDPDAARANGCYHDGRDDDLRLLRSHPGLVPTSQEATMFEAIRIV